MRGGHHRFSSLSHSLFNSRFRRWRPARDPAGDFGERDLLPLARARQAGSMLVGPRHRRENNARALLTLLDMETTMAIRRLRLRGDGGVGSSPRYMDGAGFLVATPTAVESGRL